MHSAADAAEALIQLQLDCRNVLRCVTINAVQHDSPTAVTAVQPDMSPPHQKTTQNIKKLETRKKKGGNKKEITP
jgi:hypothetical protein